MSAEMAEEQPFNMLFETFGRTPEAHAEEVNREAHDQLVCWLDVPLPNPGGCTLLRAPRAGHGKTHLLSRIRHQFMKSHEAILLRASRGYQIDASTVLEDVVRHLLDEQPGHPHLTRMDVQFATDDLLYSVGRSASAPPMGRPADTSFGAFAAQEHDEAAALLSRSVITWVGVMAFLVLLA